MASPPSVDLATQWNASLVVLGGLTLILGSFSKLLKQRLFISPPLAALCTGILVSSAVLNWVDLNQWGDADSLLEQVARFTIAIQVMSVALRLPRAYVTRHWRSLAMVLGVVMPLSALMGAVLAASLLPFSLWQALLIGAVVCPTDPVIATAIVTGKVAENCLPHQLRYLLSSESGSNDGLGLPFVLLPVLMLTRPPGEALRHWILKTWLWEVLGAIAIGAIAGYAIGHLLCWAEKHQTIDRPSFLAYTVALSIVILGGVKLTGGDGILAVFVSGLVFDRLVDARSRANEEQVQEALDRLLTISIFLCFGMSLPWQSWGEMGVNLWLVAGGIVLLHRLPSVYLLRRWIPDLRSPRDALFAGWFGPVGVATIFYSLLAVRRTGLEAIWPVASATVCLSVILHGITAVPFARWYGRVAQTHPNSCETSD